ncbi:Uncharacterised protein [Bordetella pertussis]|nr:Uncharacterised protein [Bordetella pertussis]
MPTEADFSPRSRRDRKPLSSPHCADSQARVRFCRLRKARMRRPICSGLGAGTGGDLAVMGGGGECVSTHDAIFGRGPPSCGFSLVECLGNYLYVGQQVAYKAITRQ